LLDARPTQGHAIHLLSARNRQLRDHPHLSRAFVADEPRRTVCIDLGRVDLFAGSGNNEGDQALAASVRVRRTDDSDHPDALVSKDHLLNFSGKDIKALDEHHVLLPVGDEQEAVLVEVANIARVDEPAADGLGGLFCLITVMCGPRTRNSPF